MKEGADWRADSAFTAEQAFLNFTVTLVSITFAWIVALFALQGKFVFASDQRSCR